MNYLLDRVDHAQDPQCSMLGSYQASQLYSVATFNPPILGNTTHYMAVLTLNSHWA